MILSYTFISYRYAIDRDILYVGKQAEVQLAETHPLYLYPLFCLGILYIERCRDGARGWVPVYITKEIESDHVR